MLTLHHHPSDTKKVTVTWADLNPDQRRSLRTLTRGLGEEGYCTIHKNTLRRELGITKISLNAYRCIAECLPENVGIETIRFIDSIDEMFLINLDIVKKLTDVV